jgi:hypothetical protein
MNMSNARPTPCFDNVAFEYEGQRIVGTVIEFDDDGLLVVGNPFFRVTWHVPVDEAAITGEDLTRPAE